MLDRGNIAESGTHDEPIDRRGLYASLLQVQMGLDERSIGLLKNRARTPPQSRAEGSRQG